MEESVKTLMGVVGLTIFAAIIVVIIMYAQGMINIADLNALSEGIVYPDMLDSAQFGTFAETGGNSGDFGSVYFERTTSTEIACSIAKAIRSDITAYGYDGKRPEKSNDNTYFKLRFTPERTVVARGTFKILWNPDSATGGFWNFSDITEQQQNMIMNAKGCTDTGEQWACDTPYVDEKCVSTALSHLKVGSINMCTGKSDKPEPFSVGTALGTKAAIYFGNEKCSSVVADGSTDCKGVCPSGSKSQVSDEIGAWYGPTGGLLCSDKTMISYVDDTDWNTDGKSWPPSQCVNTNLDCKDEATKFDDSGPFCEPKYTWLLIWNRNNKQYVVEFYRVPETTDLGKISTTELSDKLLQDGTDFITNLDAAQYPELRTRYDVTFQPTDAVTLNSMMSYFVSKLGSKYDFGYVNCIGDDCYNSLMIPKSWRFFSGLADKSTDYGFIDQESSGPKAKEINKVLVRRESGRIDENSPLDTTHVYRVVMRWWKSKVFEGDWKKPSCGLCTQPGDRACVACVFDNGRSESTSMCSSDCHGKGGDPHTYFYFKDVHRYQDMALIIEDLGPVEGASEAGEG
ncbi:MAG: hypothetical protein V1887_00975 [Candidatus Aenigmatarchaeota archaeon]